MNKICNQNNDTYWYANIIKTILKKKENLNFKLSSPEHTLQMDSINCGILILWYCEQIMHNEPITTPIDLLNYRYKIYNTFKEFKIE